MYSTSLYDAGECVCVCVHTWRPVLRTDVSSPVKVHSTLDGFTGVTNSPTALNVPQHLKKTAVDSEMTNRPVLRRHEEWTAVTGRAREDTEPEETRALQVHAHIFTSDGQQTSEHWFMLVYERNV